METYSSLFLNSTCLSNSSLPLKRVILLHVSYTLKNLSILKNELYVLLQNSLSRWNQEPFQRMFQTVKHWRALKQTTQESKFKELNHIKSKLLTGAHFNYVSLFLVKPRVLVPHSLKLTFYSPVSVYILKLPSQKNANSTQSHNSDFFLEECYHHLHIPTQNKNLGIKSLHRLFW